MNEHAVSRISRDTFGVSPVIAIILMVAVTIVLAGVLWLWVDSFTPRMSKKGPPNPIFAEICGRDDNNDFVIRITDTGKNDYNIDVISLRFSLLDDDHRKVNRDTSLVRDVYCTPIGDDMNVSYRDNDYDAILSVGDRFIIRSAEHVEDDGNLSPGPARKGYTFELYCMGIRILEIAL